MKSPKKNLLVGVIREDFIHKPAFELALALNKVAKEKQAGAKGI